jgi:hypothetical protein
MRYVLLMYGEEAAGETPTRMPPERAAEWEAFWRGPGQEGLLQGWGALQPTDTSTTLRVTGEQWVTTDGPFAETKEQLGGYIVLECDSLDDALDFAKRVPCGPHGSIEVRPISDFG